MQVEFIGVLAFILGIISLKRGPDFSIYMVFLSTILGASAAAILTFMGGATLQPALLLLMFVILRLLSNPYRLASGLSGLSFPKPGFWLLLTVLYAVAGSVLLPRLFAGATNVYAIARVNDSTKIALVPLAPTSGNITQNMYFTADLFAYIAFYACSRELGRRGLEVLCKAAIIYAFANAAFGVLDVATFLTGTTELLSFMRNASYSMLVEAEIAGFKRVVGSFTEASSYGATSVFILAFTGKLWLEGVFTRRAGIAAALSLLATIASTSTTAYAGLAVILPIEYLACLYQIVIRRQYTKTAGLFVLFGPIVFAFVIMAAALNESVWSSIQNIFQLAFTEKMTSDSGVERSAWNYQAMQNFFETNGLGVGVGSTRASSWPMAVLASLGAIAGGTYFFFVAYVFFRPLCEDLELKSCQKAVRTACFSQVVLLSIGSPFVDLGLFFFMCAGLSMAASDEASLSVRSKPAFYEGILPGLRRGVP